MIVMTLKAKHDHLRKVAGTRDYVKALGEFVWNAADADATRVSVEFGRNDLGGLDSILVRDDGTGISEVRARQDFESLGDSWKLAASRTAILSRAVHGKEGQGGFRFFSLARKARRTTVYGEGEKRLKLSIEIDAAGLHTSKVTELGEVSPDTPTGTIANSPAEGHVRLAGRGRGPAPTSARLSRPTCCSTPDWRSSTTASLSIRPPRSCARRHPQGPGCDCPRHCHAARLRRECDRISVRAGRHSST